MGPTLVLLPAHARAVLVSAQVSCLHKASHVIEATPKLNSVTIDLKAIMKVDWDEYALYPHPKICVHLCAVRTEPNHIECGSMCIGMPVRTRLKHGSG